MLLKFTEDAWKDYCYWQKSGQKNTEANQYPYQKRSKGTHLQGLVSLSL